MRKASFELSIGEAGAKLRSGELQSATLVHDALERVNRSDPDIHAFITLTEERALADAEQADRRFAAGIDLGPLQGIPYGLKDIILTRGVRTTCNSPSLATHVPAEDAPVEARLKQAGAILLGKLGTHEFALGGPGFDLPFPPSRNPWNLNHFTGGSSSGSGAAVAAGFIRLAIGSDTGGSIRSPACLCGVVGLKPTYGLVPRRGAYPLSYSLDHVGPITKTVEDAALALNVIAFHDPADPSSARRPATNFAKDLKRGIGDLKVGYARHYFAGRKGTSGEVVDSLDSTAALLERLGARVDEVILPDFELAKACGRILMTAEAFAIHEAEFKRAAPRFGRYMYQRVAPAALLSAADVIEAQRLRTELALELNRNVLAHYDVVLTAVAIRDAAPLDAFPKDWPPPPDAIAVQTAPFNVTGNPALSLPVGFSAAGLPLGAQLVGRYFDEAKLLGVAATLEGALGVVDKWPLLAAPEERVEAVA